MQSHKYSFTARDLLNLTIYPVLVCIGFTMVMLFGARTVFPSPKPIFDTDRTILIHQAEASRTAQDAEIILLGDSSCLMDVNARELGRLTGKRVLNLGTLSHVTLRTHAYLLNQAVRSNAQPKTVILLMHPESLRLAHREPYFDETIRAYFNGRDSRDGNLTFLRAAGADTFRSRLLTRALPIPLSGEFAEQYGFNQNLWNHLTENNGSALDPHTYPKATPSGNPEYRLAVQLESHSRDFGAQMPAKSRLIVGITPSPSDYVLRNHTETCRAMLATWSQWLATDAALTNLLFVLPPTHFATTTHLSSSGVSVYTQLLADSLR